MSTVLARPFNLDPVAESSAMRDALLAAEDVAATPTTVLLLGESGVGKEVLARFIHVRSQRATGPWVAVNCAALPAELLESELFGHERGAFTGASERRAGRFEQANGGTLLLDEISELPLSLQAKLLRVVQEREVDRVGGQRPVPVDVRIVATTNRDLAEMVRSGTFRSDLYYRLNVYPIVVPPLRERREDVVPLAERVLAEAAIALGRDAPALSTAARTALSDHDFPGNVRELRNVLERALVRSRGDEIAPHHLGLAAPARDAGGGTTAAPALDAGARLPPELPLDLASLERLAIEEALRRVDGNRTHAARLLGIGLRTLRNKLRTWRESGEVVLDPRALRCDTADAAARPFLPGSTRPEAAAKPRSEPGAPWEVDSPAGAAGRDLPDALSFARARASQGGRA